MGGGGEGHAAVLRGGRQRGGIGSDRKRWEAMGRHRLRQGEVEGGGEAQAEVGRSGRQRGGIGCGRKRWEAERRHRQR